MCEYTQNTRDRRMDRQEERRYGENVENVGSSRPLNCHVAEMTPLHRAHLALANRVRELESRLAAAQSSARDITKDVTKDDSAGSSDGQVGKMSSASRHARSFAQHVPRDDAASF